MTTARQLNAGARRPQNNATAAFHGAIAGFAATIPMTIVMAALNRQLPIYERHALPPKKLTRELLGLLGLRRRASRPAENAATTVAHFGYGSVLGVVFSMICGDARRPGIGRSVGYGFVVWLLNYVVGLPAAGSSAAATREPRRRSWMMIAAHLVWGAALGVAYHALERRHRNPRLPRST